MLSQIVNVLHLDRRDRNTENKRKGNGEKASTREPILSESDLSQMEEEAMEVLSNLGKSRESWFESVEKAKLDPHADSDKQAFKEFRRDQEVLSVHSTIRHELTEAMDQVRQHNDACLSKFNTSDAVERLVLRFADATGMEYFTRQVPINGGTARYTYWQDSSTRSQYRLFGDPGQFWTRKIYDKRNRAHEPDVMHRTN